MSDDKEQVVPEIRKFFIEKAEKMLEIYGDDLKGKIPIDILAIIRFDDDSCRAIWSKDKIIRMGLFEELKIVFEEEGLKY